MDCHESHNALIRRIKAISNHLQYSGISVAKILCPVYRDSIEQGTITCLGDFKMETYLSFR